MTECAFQADDICFVLGRLGIRIGTWSVLLGWLGRIVVTVEADERDRDDRKEEEEEGCCEDGESEEIGVVSDGGRGYHWGL